MSNQNSIKWYRMNGIKLVNILVCVCWIEVELILYQGEISEIVREYI